MTYYEKISTEFFQEEWSSYEGHWDFRHLLRYLSDRRIDISVNKGSLWIHNPHGNSIEILLYDALDSEDQAETCKELYEAFSIWKEGHNKTMEDIRSFISGSI